MDRKRLPGSISLARFYLPLTLLLILTMFGAWFVVMVYKPAKWSDRLPFTISAVDDETVGVIHLDPVRRTASVVMLPANMLVPVVNTSANYKAGSLWKYGEGEKRPGDIIQRSLELFLGIRSQAYVRVGQLPTDKRTEIAKVILRGGEQGSIGWLDRLRAFWFVSSLRDDQYQVSKLPETIGEMEELPDGSRVVSVTGERTLPLISKAYANEIVLADSRRVDISNNSGEPGMGIIAERSLAVSGALVAAVKNGDTEDFYCRVSAPKSDPNEEGLVEWINKRLGCEIESSNQGNEIEVKVGKTWGETYMRRPRGEN